MDSKQHPSPEWIAEIRQRFPTERTIDEALTRKLERRDGPPYAPTPLIEMRARIEAFAAELFPGTKLDGVQTLGGGASKEQYLFGLEQAGETQRYVLRREPPESIVETHRLREYQIMRAMKGVVPVPDVAFVDPEGEWFGRPALISSFVGGVTKPPASTSNVSGLGTDFGDRLRGIIGPQFVATLAKIHQFDWRTAELDAFDKPPVGSADGVHSVINWWDRIWEEDNFEAVPVMRLASEWLRKNAPPIDHVTVVHHDYRAGNFLFDAESGKISAILDWELAHLGDYHEDLAWTLQEGYGYHDDQGRFFVCGLIERSEFLNRYSDLTGFAIDERKLDYYSVMNAWKSTIIVIATGIRCIMGGKSHQDILLSWIAAFGNVTMNTLIKLLDKEMQHGA